MPEDAPSNGDAPPEPAIGPFRRVSEMQAKLHRWAAADPGRRFDDLFNFVYDPATLLVAFDRVAGNRGANTPGVDALTVALVEEHLGVPGFLDDLRARVKDGSFWPLPVRERAIPKPGESGKVRKLGIPVIADRVVQAALKLVLEPIFEADFLPVSYGFRPMRRAHDAIAEIHMFGSRGYQWGAGRRYRGVLRLDRSRGPDGSGARSGQGQAGAGAGEGVPQGRCAHRARRR
ncbi:reverse transcriptase domain-containing protein [Dactylosporangium roseum]|uniref:reverse transcriptase domain-containing protein n=1 Tax=Dactylosporangium roseum TaxID=47989 RepID=UPI0021B23B68|nr:reverse transcriptase domain-containing protein [Dactylosporangium roseum]